MKWYQCTKDISIALLVLLIFGIVILHYHILKIDIFTWNLMIDIFFQWGMWLPTLAVFIVAVFVCLKHYWSWTLIVTYGICFFLTIKTSNNLEGTMSNLDILRYEFSSIRSTVHFLIEVFTPIILCSPYVVVVATSVFFIRRSFKKK